MNIVKQIANEQYKEIVNTAADQMQPVQYPKEGWLYTARNALCMSAAQLARRLNVTRAYISKIEKSELSGSLTIKTMQRIAEGMECRFVYTIVPKESVEDILTERAKEKATYLVETTNKHMALEDQALSSRQISFEIERLQKKMLDDMSSDFWNDEP